MKKLPIFTAAALAVSTGAVFAAGTVDNVTDDSPYYYTGAVGAAIENGVGGKGTTDSGVNHLPAYVGHSQTNNTYRFYNVNEQVLTMIGDGKHGLWRVQDNGTIREYITQAADADGSTAGCAAPCDINDPANAATLANDYTHFDEPASFGSANNGGYKSENGFNGIPVNSNGAAGYVDLPIFHPKYGGKYDNHPAIDLPSYYCTMSANDYAKARKSMDFAFTQPAAGKVGPLGVRAGLGITENYTRVLRMEHLPDANTWINTGSENDPHWQALDHSRTNAEYYIVERPFFNEDYLFLVAVYDDKYKKREHSYIRPHGAYYDHLKARGVKIKSKKFVHNPRFAVLKENGRRNGRKRLKGTQLYGVHHPGGAVIANGACPSMGGDFGDDYYGAAWPTNYQEVTPLCDGVLVDIKFYANLDGADWDSQTKNLANATDKTMNTFGTTTGWDPSDPLRKNYTLTPGTYGTFTDPYLLNRGITNPDRFETDGTTHLDYRFYEGPVEINE